MRDDLHERTIAPPGALKHFTQLSVLGCPCMVVPGKNHLASEGRQASNPGRMVFGGLELHIQVCWFQGAHKAADNREPDLGRASVSSASLFRAPERQYRHLSDGGKLLCDR